MKLSIGIVGLPNVGKSTLFNALTKNSVPAENYPFCTIDPSVGIVEVPDERLQKLANISGSKKIIPAVVEFVDIAGLVKGASTGEGLGNKFLSHIRETDAIGEVVRMFEDDKVTHVADKVDPLFDIEIINYELMQADIETCKNRKSNIQKEVKKGAKKYILLDLVLGRLLVSLDAGKLISQTYDEENYNEEEIKEIKMLNLITAKKFLYILNKKSGGKNLDELNDIRYTNLIEYLNKNNFNYVKVDAKIEDELKDFEGDEKEEMRSMLMGTENILSLALYEGKGENSDGIKNLITEGYKMLGLCTYFTTGPEETRGWTIREGSSAPVAGQAIHTDFKDKFIRAEIVSSDDLIREGSEHACKLKGLLRTEGKEYIVKDGDVIEFKI